MSHMLTETTFTNKADTRAIINEVISNAFEAVCATMGPNGEYAVINQLNQPKVTKDGVSVAKALDFNETRRNMIAKIITEPAIKTDKEVGDGTTTTIFMTYHLYQMFHKQMTFKNIRFLDGLIEQVSKLVAKEIIPVKVDDPEFRNMLLTSSNYEEEIVDKVLEIFSQYKNPNIRLEKNDSLPADEIIFTKEIAFKGNYLIDEWIPNTPTSAIRFPVGGTVVLLDCHVRGLTQDMINLITQASPGAPAILLARNFDPNVITQIRSESANLKRCIAIPYKVEAVGTLGSQVMNDLGQLLGATPLADVNNITEETICKTINEVTLAPKALMFNKATPSVEEIATRILEQIDQRYENMNIVDRQTPVGKELARRVGRLRANNVTLLVSGTVPSEASERYYRYEDVMKAATTALEFGVIPGIGYGYISAREALEAFPKQSDEGLEQLVDMLKSVLVAQYEHLTEHKYTGIGTARYVDLVSGEESDKPMNVYDNAAATMTALKGAWSTAKTLGKLSNVMGRSNSNYS